jgi:muconolactone delta-isomerase
MIKFNSTSDWSFDVPPVNIVHEVRDLRKIAAAQDELQVQKTAGQTDVHVIALGAYEGIGQNRNGDLFKEAECMKHYKTFVKSGSKRGDGSYDGRALNRHHKNKPEDPKYGNIKAAAYNKDMRRIELVVGLDNDKCAEELHKLASGEQINVSMAAKVASDICTWCGHEAKDDRGRCEHIPAKIGELNKQGEMCGMDNVSPKWFELSIVGRPADRIGMSLKLAHSYAPKLASDYLKLYTGFIAPQEADNFLISKKAADKRSLLKKLSEMEKRIEGIAKAGPKDSEEKYIANESTKLNVDSELSSEVVDELRKQDPSKLLKLLAENGIVFSPKDFVQYLFGDKLKDRGIVEKMRARLPSGFSDMDDDVEDCVANNEKYDPSEIGGFPKDLKRLVQGLFDNHSLFDAPSHGRIMRITIIGRSPKKLTPTQDKNTLEKDAAADELAQQYLAYKLAALRYMEEYGRLDDQVLLNSLIQNR